MTGCKHLENITKCLEILFEKLKVIIYNDSNLIPTPNKKIVDFINLFLNKINKINKIFRIIIDGLNINSIFKF